MRNSKISSIPTVFNNTLNIKFFSCFLLLVASIVFSSLAHAQKSQLSVGNNGNGSEPGTPASFIFTLDISKNLDTGIDYVIGGTAMAGTDYVALSGTIVMPGFSNSVILDVPVIDDQLVEGTEDIVLTIVSVNNPGVEIGLQNQATVNIADNDATLTVITQVVNNDGGVAVASDWTMDVTASNSSSASFPGAESPGTTITLAAGAYSVDESGGPAGYTKTLGAGCSGTAVAGGNYSCTITNDDIPTYGELTLSKISDVSTYSAISDVINYGYLVTNVGAYPVAGPITIADDKVMVTCPDVLTIGNLDHNFDPGESITCAASYTVVQADIDATSITNTATASGDFGETVSNSDQVTVVYTNAEQLPDLVAINQFPPDYSRSSLAPVHFGVYNQGPIPSGNYQISFLRSADIVIDTSDIEFNNLMYPAVESQTTYYFTEYLTFPSVNIGFPYWGFCIVDAGVEVTTGNNCSGAFNYPEEFPSAPTSCSVSSISCGDAATGDLDINDCEMGPRDTPIGQSFEGTPYYLAEVFEFQGTAGETVNILADWLETVDGYLYLENPLGQIEIFNDDYPNFGDIALSKIENHVLEQTGTYRLWLTTYQEVQLGSFNLSLTCDYPVSPGTISISPTTYTVAENSGSVTVTVSRTGGSDGAVSVNYSTANGTAVAASDYTQKSGTLSWANAESGSKSVNIPIINDSIAEASENFTLTISAPTGGASLGTATATVTITDDDPQATPGTISISPTTYTVAENGGSVMVTVGRTGGSDGAVSVNYTTANGTAVAASDYTQKSGTLSWADGESGSKSVSIPIINDAIAESSENFKMTISAPTGGASLGTATATVTITDDDPQASPGTISVSPSSYSVAENSGPVMITVSRTGGSDGAVSVNYGTSNGTAVAASDYTQKSGTLSWADGESGSKSVSIPIINDAIAESSENFRLTISAPTGGASLGTTTATVTITDDDPADVSIQQFSASPSQITEGQVVTLTWVTEGASQCMGLNGVAAWRGEKAVSGSQSVQIEAAGLNVFRLDCSNGSDGTASANTSVEVLGSNPDLDLESLTLSTSQVTTNQTLSANAVFRNIGDGTSATSTFRWYLSNNEGISSTDQLLASGSLANLAPGEAVTKSLSENAPAAAGSYWLGICADPVEGEPDTANNCSAGVRLSVTSTVSCNISSTGCDAIESAALGVADCQSGPLGPGHYATGRSFAGVAGQSVILAANWDGADGYLALQSPDGVIVKANDDYGDSSRSRIEYQLQQTGNYTAWLTTFAIGTEPSFDLALTCPSQQQPDLSASLLTGPLAEVEAGQSFQVDFDVTNIGQGSADASSLRYLLSTNASITANDQQLGQAAVPSLGPSAGVTRNAMLAIAAPGDYWIGACIDSVEGEGLTGNNCSTGRHVTVRSVNNCNSSNVELGNSVTGSLGGTDCDKSPRGAAYYGKAFTIAGTQGERIGLEASWNGFDGYLYLEGPDGKVVAENDDTSDSSGSAIEVELPETGEYKAWVTSYSPEASGSFALSSGEIVACEPQLTADSISADKDVVSQGEQVTVSTQLSYQGCGETGSSEESLLRYFISTNNIITTSDTEVGTDVIDSMQSGNSSFEYALVEAPVSSGRYWIGACVEKVDDNCVVSDPIEVQSDIESIPFNAGMNDAWYDRDKSGQGMLITVLPASKFIFIAWFTYDTELPPQDAVASLGDPGQRWMTAYGGYEGNSATLKIEMTRGGVFNSSSPPVAQSNEGTVQLQFTDCNKGILQYDIPSIGLQGTVEIERVTLENMLLCESLLSEDQQNQSAVSIEADPPVLRTGEYSSLTWQSPPELDCVSGGGGGLWPEGMTLEKSGSYKVRVSTEGKNDFSINCADSSNLESSVGANARVNAISTEEDSVARHGQKVLFNNGLNDAWYDLDTSGQGVLLTVVPDIKFVFLAWFTFDVQRPPANTPFQLGDPGHRWLTAFGRYDEDQAQLRIELTKGGIFDSPVPKATRNDSYGTMDLSFADCNSGQMSYNIPSIGLNGTIPLARISGERIGDCQQQDGIDDPVDVLYKPKPKDTLPNSCGGSYTWEFEWEAQNGFTHYQVEIYNGRSDEPVSRKVVADTRLNLEKSEVITSDYLSSWSWRVRAVSPTLVGPWSEERTFNVAPVSACN